MKCLKSSIFSQGLEVSALDSNELADLKQSHSAKSNLIVAVSSPNIGQAFPVMEILEPSLPTNLDQMELPLMLSAADSPVRTSAVLENVQELMEAEANFGQNLPALLVSYDLVSSSWRMSQLSLDGAWTEFSETWPTSGMMRNGNVYKLPTLAHRIAAKESSLLPTPSGTRNHGRNHVIGRLDEWGGSSNPFRGTPIGKVRSPSFEEWMMGFPISWTELTPCVTPSFPKSQNLSDTPSSMQENLPKKPPRKLT